MVPQLIHSVAMVLAWDLNSLLRATGGGVIGRGWPRIILSVCLLEYRPLAWILRLSP